VVVRDRCECQPQAKDGERPDLSKPGPKDDNDGHHQRHRVDGLSDPRRVASPLGAASAEGDKGSAGYDPGRHDGGGHQYEDHDQGEDSQRAPSQEIEGQEPESAQRSCHRQQKR